MEDDAVNQEGYGVGYEVGYEIGADAMKESIKRQLQDNIDLRRSRIQQLESKVEAMMEILDGIDSL